MLAACSWPRLHLDWCTIYINTPVAPAVILTRIVDLTGIVSCDGQEISSSCDAIYSCWFATTLLLVIKEHWKIKLIRLTSWLPELSQLQVSFWYSDIYCQPPNCFWRQVFSDAHIATSELFLSATWLSAACTYARMRRQLCCRCIIEEPQAEKKWTDVTEKLDHQTVKFIEIRQKIQCFDGMQTIDIDINMIDR